MPLNLMMIPDGLCVETICRGQRLLHDGHDRIDDPLSCQLDIFATEVAVINCQNNRRSRKQSCAAAVALLVFEV